MFSVRIGRFLEYCGRNIGENYFLVIVNLLDVYILGKFYFIIVNVIKWGLRVECVDFFLYNKIFVCVCICVLSVDIYCI